MEVVLGQQYNVGEKPIILYTHISRYAGTPNKDTTKSMYSTSSTCVFLTFSVLFANPKKLLYKHTVANPARGLLSREKNTKKNPGSAPPPPRCSFGENTIKITRRIYMPRRYAVLGPSRVRTRIHSTRRLDQWVSLRKILRSKLPCAITTFPVVSLPLSSPGDV